MERRIEVTVGSKGLSPNQLLLEISNAPEIVGGIIIVIDKIYLIISNQEIFIGNIKKADYLEIKSMDLKVISWEVVLPTLQENIQPTKSWQLIEPIKLFLTLKVSEYGSIRTNDTTTKEQSDIQSGRVVENDKCPF